MSAANALAVEKFITYIIRIRPLCASGDAVPVDAFLISVVPGPFYIVLHKIQTLPAAYFRIVSFFRAHPTTSSFNDTPRGAFCTVSCLFTAWYKIKTLYAARKAL